MIIPECEEGCNSANDKSSNNINTAVPKVEPPRDSDEESDTEWDQSDEQEIEGRGRWFLWFCRLRSGDLRFA